MPRPTVDEETRDRLEKIVDRKADVPASVLTFNQQLSYLLDRMGPKQPGAGVNQTSGSSGSSGRFR
jgi:hypothetical protein